MLLAESITDYTFGAVLVMVLCAIGFSFRVGWQRLFADSDDEKKRGLIVRWFEYHFELIRGLIATLKDHGDRLERIEKKLDRFGSGD